MKRKKNIDALDDLDMVVDSRPLTKEEEIAISAFIRANNEKIQLQELRREARKKNRKAKQLAK